MITLERPTAVAGEHQTETPSLQPEQPTTRRRLLISYILVAFACVLWQLPLVFQGLDLTDFGNHLYNQVHSYPLADSTNLMHMPWFLSDFIGGAWLALGPQPSVGWAKIGYLILVAINAMLVLRIVSAFAPILRSAAAVIATSAVASSVSLSPILDYYTVPAVLQNSLLCLIVTLLKQPANGWRFRVSAFSAGAVAACVIMARIPLVFILAIPIILYVYGRLARRDVSILHRGGAIAMAGFVVALGGLILLYQYIGVLNSYFTETFGLLFKSAKGSAGSHSLSRMIKYYLVDSCYMLPLWAGLGIIWISFRFLRHKWASAPTAMLLVAASALWGWLLFSGASTFYLLNYLTCGVVLAGLGVFFWHYRSRRAGLAGIMICSVFMMVLSPLGSNTGLYKLFYAAWVPAALALVVFIGVGLERLDYNRRALAVLGFGLMSLLLLMGVSHQFLFVYRDSQSRTSLNARFNSPGLENVYSTPRRVRVVDDTIRRLSQMTRKGDAVVMENSIPLLYYLTQTTSFTGDPWGILKTQDRFEKDMEVRLRQCPPPKLVVIARTNPLNANWPCEEAEVALENDLVKIAYLKRRFIHDLGYRYAWSNELVEVFCPPGRDKQTGSSTVSAE